VTSPFVRYLGFFSGLLVYRMVTAFALYRYVQPTPVLVAMTPELLVTVGAVKGVETEGI
jgi:hypothetical protein